MVLSALGGGAALLTLFLPNRLTPHQIFAWGFVLGSALIGWLMQPLCLMFGVSTAVLVMALIPGLLGLTLLPRLSFPNRNDISIVTWGLVFALCLLAFGDVLEALSPMADADTLAYHFALPKQFLLAGHFSFTPRAVDGAVPLLYQMTYMVALGLGGERAATLWSGLTGWGMGAAVWAFARPYLSREQALGLVALMMGIPAVLYGAGTGQVEVRLSALAVVALGTAAKAAKDWRWAVVAGLAGGFAMATKYPGLLITGMAGLCLFVPRPRLIPILAYSVTALIAGGGWYLWNWTQSGDPIFPMLYGLLPYKPGLGWSPSMAEQLGIFVKSEHPAPPSLFTALTYPFLATFDGLPGWEAGRTGLGLLPVMLIPFALSGFWSQPKTARSSSLMTILSVCCVAYFIWIIEGPSQRVRHLLPLIVPATSVAMIAAWRGADRIPSLKIPLIAGLIGIGLLQMTGQAVFSLKNIRYVFGPQDRTAYLSSQLPFSVIAFWINSNLGPTDKVASTKRELMYLIDVPVEMVSWLDGRFHNGGDLPLQMKQFRTQGITHVIDSPEVDDRLSQAGCATPLAHFQITPLFSRSLQIRMPMPPEHLDVFALTYDTCPY